MREIALDTETTGLSPESGHRVVEIGCVEMINHVPTGKVFHHYLDPERDMPAEAEAIHGLSSTFLSGQPKFVEIADDFLAFLSGARLIIHNAEFDLRFLNAELARIGRPKLDHDVKDTVLLARRKFPGAQANLDALCKRFNIDTSARDKHGALLDAGLLAQVYLELQGGRQPGLALASEAGGGAVSAATAGGKAARPPRPHGPTAEETAAHEAFLGRIKDPIWKS